MNDCVARAHSAARCRVLGRPDSHDYRASLRPCIALADLRPDRRTSSCESLLTRGAHARFRKNGPVSATANLGLEGVVAFETEIAEPDKEGSALRYRGVDIEELAGKVPFEQVWGLVVNESLENGLPLPAPEVRAGRPQR